MATLLLVSPADPRARARIKAELGNRHRTLHVPSWSGVPGALGRGAIQGVLIDLLSETTLPFAELAWLGKAHPGLATVVILDPRGRELDLFRLGRLGIDGAVLAAGVDDPPSLETVAERALARATGRRIAGRLDGRVPAAFLEALRWSVEHALLGPGPADLARSVAARSVRNYRSDLRRAGLPPPSRILLWGRLLMAAHLLDREGPAVDRVAHRLGYAAASSLARALRRETGLPPSEIRSRGGMTCVLEALLASPDIPHRPPVLTSRRPRRGRLHSASERPPR